jgi:hypothetical protein
MNNNFGTETRGAGADGAGMVAKWKGSQAHRQKMVGDKGFEPLTSRV